MGYWLALLRMLVPEASPTTGPRVWCLNAKYQGRLLLLSAIDASLVETVVDALPGIRALGIGQNSDASRLHRI